MATRVSFNVLKRWRLWFYEVKMMRPKVPRRLQRNTRREPQGERSKFRDNDQSGLRAFRPWGLHSPHYQLEEAYSCQSSHCDPYWRQHKAVGQPTPAVYQVGRPGKEAPELTHARQRYGKGVSEEREGQGRDVGLRGQPGPCPLCQQVKGLARRPHDLHKGGQDWYRVDEAEGGWPP